MSAPAPWTLSEHRGPGGERYVVDADGCMVAAVPSLRVDVLERLLRLPDLERELAEAYLELRKQRPAVTAVFDREVWRRAEASGVVPGPDGGPS